MNIIERIDRHRSFYGFLLVGIYLVLNNTVNAVSEWTEHSRNGNPDISLWEPFVWEYSSAIATLVLLPFLIQVFQRFPPRFTKIKSLIAIHLLTATVFSLAHSLLMVWLRETAYLLSDASYSFGPWGRELWYEYRKDVWGYLFFYVMYQMIQLAYSRLKGEANLIAEDEQVSDSRSQVPEHLLVKKLDKEFLVKVADIEWFESAGNYVNLYSKDRIYPLRSTMASLSKRLESVGFSRIHRGYGVNNTFIDNITYHTSGDGDVLLKSGKKLKLSRRYKNDFKQALS